MSFKSVAQSKTTATLSHVMEGRVKVSMDEIISTYPQGITITAFDIISKTDESTGEVDTFPVINFKENAGVFAFGGKVLGEICTSWKELGNGDCQKASELLASEGGVLLKFSKGKTKKGRQVINVEVVE